MPFFRLSLSAFTGLLLLSIGTAAVAVPKAATPLTLSFRVKAQFQYSLDAEDATPGDALDAKVVAQGKQHVLKPQWAKDRLSC